MANSIPEKMKTKTAMAINQDKLAKERTELSIKRTELAFLNSHMSLNRTHLSYLRTIVTLIGSGATLYKALPVLGVSIKYSTFISFFLFVFAAYFIYKDATVYPKMKKDLEEMESKVEDLKNKTEDEIFEIEV